MKFETNPERYLKKTLARAATAALGDGFIYTRPMHPQIRQVGPGTETVTADSGPNPELKDISLRFWVALALTTPVFVLEMGGHLPMTAPTLNPRDHLIVIKAQTDSKPQGWRCLGRAIHPRTLARGRVASSCDPSPSPPAATPGAGGSLSCRCNQDLTTN